MTNIERIEELLALELTKRSFTADFDGAVAILSALRAMPLDLRLALADEIGAGRNALTSSDGKFMCTPDHAVEIAYMLSSVEGYFHKAPADRSEVAELLVDYLDGNEDAESIHKVLTEWEDDLRPSSETSPTPSQQKDAAHD